MRRAASFGVLAVTAALLVPSTALAQEEEEPPALPPPAESGGAVATPTASATIDAVHLRNGGLYRGRVTEIVPGDHVTVIVDQGETKRVPWAEVDRVIVATTAVPAPPTSTTPARGIPAPATPPLPAPMVGPRARVHITSSKNVILYRRPASSSGWVQACASPCNEELPIGDTYRLTGNGVSSSKEFRLDASPGGSVDVAVDPPSTGGMVLGGFLAGGGATAAYVGMLAALVGASDASRTCYGGGDSYCERRKSDAEDVRNGGLIAMGVGAGLTVVGILVFLNSAKTDIVQTSGKGTAAAPTPRPLDAFLRQPTWHRAASSSERAAAAPAASFPLVLGGTF
ncbi:MAG: hypothetical protein KIS78_02355 [Labilithrix sp.]|nr:hypothetical protein [Labilithrix sp.]MCW5831284.1 hypothetical protein [Labilithrix sp.]